jgi:hypothetical protein
MIPAVVLTWFRTNPRNVYLIGGLLLVAIAAGWLYLKGRHDADERTKARARIAAAVAVKTDVKAAKTSQDDLAKAATVAIAKQQELEDAVANVPDTVPDSVAVVAACVELRQHGVSTANLPACQPAH